MMLVKLHPLCSASGAGAGPALRAENIRKDIVSCRDGCAALQGKGRLVNGPYTWTIETTTIMQTTMLHQPRFHVFRLLPGEDLLQGIRLRAAAHAIRAGWMGTCVGSLTHYHLRFADRPGGTRGTGPFEIVSLAGTVSVNGCHLHTCLADHTGRTTGGHVLEGCVVYTTAEIVIGALPGLVFTRERDGTTPWAELQIRSTG